MATTESPIALLNQAVALGYAGDVEGAFSRLRSASEHPVLRGSHLPSAIQAHLHALRGEAEQARRYARHSASLGGSPQEQHSMHQQIERLLQIHSG